MKCERCEGTMVYERVLYQGRVFPMMKCLFCGDLIDWVILLNRINPALVDGRRSERGTELVGAQSTRCG